MTTPSNELKENVRHWVHFDNLAESLNKQVVNARAMRKSCEEKILKSLDTPTMRNAVLQITGATLQRETETKPQDLSWTMLEEQLHTYFRGRARPDETTQIIEHIRKNRGTKISEYLKKTLTADHPGKKTPTP